MSGYAVKKDGSGWRSVNGPKPIKDQPDWIAPDPDTEDYLPYEDGPPPPPIPLPAEVEALAFEALASRQRKANDQIASIQGRIDAINDAIELEDSLPEEIQELPGRESQLKAWKRYRIDLGRVPMQSGWFHDPLWPSPPDAY